MPRWSCTSAVPARTACPGTRSAGCSGSARSPLTDVSVASYAFDYTIGPRSTGPWYDPPVFPWTCPTCGQTIRDRGPVLMPVADEKGHADGCGRLAAVQAEWQARR